LVLDSDVLVHALRIPGKKDLMEIHEKASAIFESCILKTNDLFLPSEIPVEVGAVLSKIIPQELAREGIEKLLLTAEEIYPFASDMALNSIYSISSNIYFQEALENAIMFTKIEKNDDDRDVRGWKDSKTEVMIGGMDVLVLTYAQLKNCTLVTNDWSLWYVARRTGIVSHWLSGLTDEMVYRIVDGEMLEQPV
jgi:predicted nucleic acid-binding protein